MYNADGIVSIEKQLPFLPNTKQEIVTFFRIQTLYARLLLLGKNIHIFVFIISREFAGSNILNFEF